MPTSTSARGQRAARRPTLPYCYRSCSGTRQCVCRPIVKKPLSMVEASRRSSQNTTSYGLLKETFVEKPAERGVEDGAVPAGTQRLPRVLRLVRRSAVPAWTAISHPSGPHTRGDCFTAVAIHASTSSVTVTFFFPVLRLGGCIRWARPSVTTSSRTFLMLHAGPGLLAGNPSVCRAVAPENENRPCEKICKPDHNRPPCYQSA
jgi:hypothetical protein